jgi:hypothetical protein
MLFTTFNNNAKDYKIKVSNYILYYGQSITRWISRKAQCWCGRAAGRCPIATEPLTNGGIGGWFGTTVRQHPKSTQ